MLNLAKLSALLPLDKVEPRFCSRNACRPCVLLRCSWLRLQRSRLNPCQSQLGGRLRVRLLCTNQLDFVMPSPATITRCRPHRPDRQDGHRLIHHDDRQDDRRHAGFHPAKTEHHRAGRRHARRSHPVHKSNCCCAFDSLVDLRTGLVYGIDEEGEWYFNGSGKRPEELKKEEE